MFSVCSVSTPPQQPRLCFATWRNTNTHTTSGPIRPWYSFTPKLSCTSQSSLYCPLHLHGSHNCNTLARLVRKIRPLTDPPCVCHTPYNIGSGNIYTKTEGRWKRRRDQRVQWALQMQRRRIRPSRANCARSFTGTVNRIILSAAASIVFCHLKITNTHKIGAGGNVVLFSVTPPHQASRYVPGSSYSAPKAPKATFGSVPCACVLVSPLYYKPSV